MPNKAEKINTDKSVRNSQEPLELLDRGSFEAQVEEVQNFMKEHFEDEYGQDRVAHVMEKLSQFEGLETWFTERQIARLALLDVVDPSYKYEDPNRPNTHFEDVVQMAEFVDQNHEWLESKMVGMHAEKNELIFAIINSDIGKAGITSSTAMAKFFNLKDEKKSQERHGIITKKEIKKPGKKAGEAQNIGDVMKLADLDGQESNWKAIAEYLNLNDDVPRDQIANMKSSEVYASHELKVNELSQALKENPEFSDDPEKRILLLQLAVSHHINREVKVVKSLDKKGYLRDAILFDIIDKAQAFLLRGRESLNETYESIKDGVEMVMVEADLTKDQSDETRAEKKLEAEKLQIKIRKEYRNMLDRLFEAVGKFDSNKKEVGTDNFLSRELKRLESER